MSDTEEGSEPWFFSGESPIKNWADEEDEENDLDYSNSWLEAEDRETAAGTNQEPHPDSRHGTAHQLGGRAQMGPLNPVRGGRRKSRGARGGGPNPRSGGQPATPQRPGKKNPSIGRTPSPAKGKGSKKGEGKEAEAPAVSPKRNGKREPKKKAGQKFVAVNRTSNSESAGQAASSTLADDDTASLAATSATTASAEDGPGFLVTNEEGALSYTDETEVGIAHTLFPTVSDDFKSQMLLELLQAADPAQSFIVFMRENSTVIAMAEQIDKINVGTVALKEDDPIELITVYTDEFRMGKYRVLLIPEAVEAHTILSGLEHVTHALNYDVPDVDRYMARLSALRAEGDELIPLDMFTFITPVDEPTVFALEEVFGPLRRHIGSVSSSLQPQQDVHQHVHPTYQQHDTTRAFLHQEQKAQRTVQQNRQRRQDKAKYSSPSKQQNKPTKTKQLKQPVKTPKEMKGFLSNAARFNTGASESWRSSPPRSSGARTSVGGGDRWRS